MSKDFFESDHCELSSALSIARSDDEVRKHISLLMEKWLLGFLRLAAEEKIHKSDWESRKLGKQRPQGFNISYKRWESALDGMREDAFYSDYFKNATFPHGYQKFVLKTWSWTPSSVHTELVRIAFEAYLSN